MPTRLLVTGGAGFIGSHLVDAALAEGYQVGVLDDFSTGKRENLAAGATLFEVDLRDGDGVRAALRSFRPRLVSHHAAQASVPQSVATPLADMEVNVAGTLHVLEAAREAGVERLVYASTGGAVYGEVPDGKRAAPDWLPRPRSPYACSKLAAESYLGAYAHLHGLQSQVLRYANVYGPRQDPHGESGVVAIFCHHLRRGEPVRIYGRRAPGDGGCVRDYTFVGDVVRAHLAALRGRLATKLERGAGVANIGTGAGTGTAELARLLAATAGRTLQHTDEPPRPGDVERSVLDPGELPSQLGGLTPLAEGLATTWRWFASCS